MTTGDRVKKLQKLLGFKSVEAFSEELSVNKSRVNDVIRGKQKLPEDLMFTLILKYNVNANWLVAGVGDVFIGNIPTNALSTEETALLEDYRESNEQGKEAIEKTAKALAEVSALTHRKTA